MTEVKLMCNIKLQASIEKTDTCFTTGTMPHVPELQRLVSGRSTAMLPHSLQSSQREIGAMQTVGDKADDTSSLQHVTANSLSI